MATEIELRQLFQKILLSAAQAERLGRLLNESARVHTELDRIARRVVSDAAENKKLILRLQKFAESR